MSLLRLGVLIKTFRAIRGVIVALIFTALILPVVLYIVLSSNWAFSKICQIGEQELGNLLGTEVSIGSVHFRPFNSLVINDIAIKDDNDSTALTVHEIDARFEVWDLIRSSKIIIDYATIERLDVHLYRDSVNSPLNVQRIINKLSNKDTEKPKTVFNLRLNDAELTDCSMSYDIFAEPETPGRFNKSHILIYDLNLVAFAPILSNERFKFSLRSMNFEEQSGLQLSNLEGRVDLNDKELKVDGLKVELPGSELAFADIAAKINGFDHLAEIGKDDITLGVLPCSHIYLPDLKAFVPVFDKLENDVDIDLQVIGSKDHINIESLNLSERNNMFTLALAGSVSDFSDPWGLSVSDLNINAAAHSHAVERALINAGVKLNPDQKRLISEAGRSTVAAIANGSLNSGSVVANIISPLAEINVDGSFHHANGSKIYSFDGVVSVDSMRLGTILSDKNFGDLTADFDINGRFTKKSFHGDIQATIGNIDYKGYRYHDLHGDASVENDNANLTLKLLDPNIKADLVANWHKMGNVNSIDCNLDIFSLRLDQLNITEKYPDYSLDGSLDLNFKGESIDKFLCELQIDDVDFRNDDGKGVSMDNFTIYADNVISSGRVSVTSDYINGTIDGPYNPSTLKSDIVRIYETLLPALAKDFDGVNDKVLAKVHEESGPANDFTIDFTIDNCTEILEFFKAPAIPLGDLNISGYLNSLNNEVYLKVDTPWLQSGNNIIESLSTVVNISADEDIGCMMFTALIPTKKGLMNIDAHVDTHDQHLDTDIFWEIERSKPINGNILFNVFFSRDADDKLSTQVNFNPGEIGFGDEVWSIQKSMITLDGQGEIFIDNFALTTPTQRVVINGRLGTSEEDKLTVELSNIQLIEIFETLDINNALIGGYATGIINGEALLSKNPIIQCDQLSVKSIGYNYCTFGDAKVKLGFDDGGKIFNFDAVIDQGGGRQSYLDGYIEPATESLDLNIKADRIPVGFMKPFMEAFTSDVKGYASGDAHLYGTFKDIDMTGDVYADSLQIKIDFTNTWYHTSDSIHIRPGKIQFHDVVLEDEQDHKALLSGWVGHEYFHNASFDFSVTDAVDFLCYDVTEKLSPDWYGKIYGDGSVSVKGRPGVVDISAKITTASNSIFTFVLSDQLVADEYSFITFRDVTPRQDTDSILHKNIIPDRVLSRFNGNNSQQDDPTAYNMDLTVDITPQAQIVIVMDPIGGDRIRSNGHGNMRMTYRSVDNDLRLYGTYTLERGNYNFTLQDIIIKDFTIKEGSNISFTGDPYSAQLDIDAYYQVNANLSDLDESFLQDKDLNRTNVPVRALMMVKGDMRQPDISFDLEFPSLTTQDTYRKVKSIISTEDMMNMQIIYLLALNRFYTPEYMASTTRGNELFSVASSTISSQLSNMLGKLSDNWSIAPNLRSDRGDFSDLEVDLTLSSSLLNNRLLLNGNFGYRDKSLNTNQFVGDFDIEYLLTRSGEWRLKAYNRYNDQNYYLRNAQTTQGVGVVYRRDFDKTLRFLKHFRSNKDDNKAIVNDTISIDMTPNDSIKVTESVETVIENISQDK